MLDELLQLVYDRNPYQMKYLQTAMDDITEKEVQKLENLINFYTEQGDTLENIANKYLNLIDVLMEEQKHFLENGDYRFSSFKEVEDLYQTSLYMDSYMVWLGLSTYLWYIHRGMMRFFLEQCRQLTKGGGGF